MAKGILERIIGSIDNTKRKLEPGIDKYMALGAANLAALHYVPDTISQIPMSTTSQDLALLGAGAGLVAANYQVLKKGVLNRTIAATNKILDISRPISWVKSAALTAGLVAATVAMYPKGQEVFTDAQKIARTPSITQPTVFQPESQLVCGKNPRAHSRDSMEGRFLRTYRWDNTIRREERRHGIPEGLLAGLAMQESRGDPLAINDLGNGRSDGGAGLFQIQPGNAQHAGLNIYGTSRATGRDLNHGNDLLALRREKNRDYKALSQMDDRFNIDYATEAAANILTEKHRRAIRDGHRGDDAWRTAVTSYNRGTRRSVRQGLKNNITHTRNVYRFQEHYNRRSRECRRVRTL